MRTRKNPVAKLLNARRGNAGCAVSINCAPRVIPSKKAYIRREKHPARTWAGCSSVLTLEVRA